MEIQKTSTLNVEYTQSNFILHNFWAEFNNDSIVFQTVKMLDSLYIWIGYSNQKNFNDLSVAMDNKYGSVPVSTRLIGDTTEETSKNIAIKLSKKLKKVVYVSLNVADDRLTLPVIDKRIQEEIGKFPEYF